MSRAPLFALLLALALAATIAPVAGWAAPRDHSEDQADAAPQALLLPKSAIAAAVRRTAVADPDLDGEVTSIEAAQYYERRLSLLDENRDGSIDRPEFVRAVAVRSLYAVDGFAQPRPLAFESVDVDGNGVLTPEEFLRADLLRRSASMSGGSRRPPACPLRFGRRRSRRPAEPTGVHACRPPGLSSQRRQPGRQREYLGVLCSDAAVGAARRPRHP